MALVFPAGGTAAPHQISSTSSGSAPPIPGNSTTSMRLPPPLHVSVRGLAFPYQLSEEDVRRVFGRYGEVDSVRVLNEESANVTFLGFGNALAAWNDLNNKALLGIDGAFLFVSCPELEGSSPSRRNTSKDEGGGGTRWSDMQTSDQGGKKYTCRLEIGIENEKEFRVGSKVIQIARRIWEELPTFRASGGKTRLRGKGVGGPHESEEPLALCISCREIRDFGVAVEFAEQELTKVHEAFIRFQEETHGIAPDVTAAKLPACKAVSDHLHTVAPGFTTTGTAASPATRASAAKEQETSSTVAGGGTTATLQQQHHTGATAVVATRGRTSSNMGPATGGEDQPEDNSPPISRGVRPPTAPDDDEIEHMIEQRNEARKGGNYDRADEIRDYLKSVGVVLMDDKGARGNRRGAEVTKWRYWNP